MLPSIDAFDENSSDIFSTNSKSLLLALGSGKNTGIRPRVVDIAQNDQINQRSAWVQMFVMFACSGILMAVTYSARMHRKAMLHRMFLLLALLVPTANAQQEPTQFESLFKDPDQLKLATSKILSRVERSLVGVACISRKSARPINSNTLELDSMKQAIEPTNPAFVADRYCTGFVLSENGLILVPYSVLGDPESLAYFVWHKGSVAHGRLTAVKAEVVAGEPYSNLAVLHILDEGFNQATATDQS